MTRHIDPRDYRRLDAPGAGNGPALVELRLYRTAGGRADDNQYREALRFIVDNGEVPEGWELRGAKWAHFSAGEFRRWREGDAVELANFGAVVGSVRNVDMGIERKGTGEFRYRSTRTGRFVKSSYARRYPHLVAESYEHEEAVIRVTYGEEA